MTTELNMNEIVVSIADNMNDVITFKTSAKTLGELRRELQEKYGLETQDKSFKEGGTLTELLNDEAILPRFKGQTPLTELFFLVTTANKKINSGIDYESMTRIQLVSTASNFVKGHPEFKAEFGNVSSTKSIDLINLLKKHTEQKNTPTPETTPVKESSQETATETTLVKPEITVQKIDNTWVREFGATLLEGMASAMRKVPMELYVEVIKSSFSDEDIARMTQLLTSKK